MDNAKSLPQDMLLRRVLMLNARVLGLVLGLFMGLAVFVATNWLVIKGGHVGPKGQYVVGPHLQLLSQFFIGYRVSFLGSLIGFVYAFTLGTMCGAAIGWIYNAVVRFRDRISL